MNKKNKKIKKKYRNLARRYLKILVSLPSRPPVQLWDNAQMIENMKILEVKKA